MASRFQVDDTAWLVESNRIIREVRIIRLAGSFYVVQFKDSGGTIHMRGTRLLATEEEAKKSVRGTLYLMDDEMYSEFKVNLEDLYAMDTVTLKVVSKASNRKE